MPDYRWVNIERLNRLSREENVGGVRFVVHISPYDTPKRVIGSYDQEDGTFTIEFAYIDAEPAGAAVQYEGLSVLEGRHSGKLLSIIIPIDADPFSNACFIELQTKVREALSARAQRIKGRTDRELNNEAVREVIEKDLSEIAGR